MKNGMRRRKSGILGIQLSACTQSTGPQLDRPGTLKLVKNQVPVIFLEMLHRQCTQSTGPYLGRLGTQNFAEITETWIFQTGQELISP